MRPDSTSPTSFRTRDIAVTLAGASVSDAVNVLNASCLASPGRSTAHKTATAQLPRANFAVGKSKAGNEIEVGEIFFTP